MTAPLISAANASGIVHRGGVVAYPTEAVYGLGCDPHNPDAVARVLEVKTRPQDKGLILIASHLSQLQDWIAPLDHVARARVESTWPGHTTWIVPASDDCPAQLSGGRDTVAVRVTAHPVSRALCDAVGHAIVSTSANRSGEPAIRDIASLGRLDGIDAIVEGKLGSATDPSAIYRLSDGARLR